MQRRIRTFLAEYNRRSGATIMLTSHYTADVEALCKRVIVIYHGRVLYDGALTGLVDRFASYRQVGVTLEAPADLSAYGEVASAWPGGSAPQPQPALDTVQMCFTRSVLPSPPPLARFPPLPRAGEGARG